MPDITMCGSICCPVRKYCYRNPASGTEPSEFRQSWFLDTSDLEVQGEDCRYFWPPHGGKT